MRQSTTADENQRQYELVDQLLSMHSSLRDRYQGRAFWLNTFQIAVSLFLSVFAFVGDDTLLAFGYGPTITRFLLGYSAVIALTLSIAEFRVDWKVVGSRHANAAAQLAGLKARYRKAFTGSPGGDSSVQTGLTTEYDKTVAMLPTIPERHFVKLKARHQFKRLLSQAISHNPKVPRWFLCLQLRLEGVRKVLKRKEVDLADEGDQDRNR